MDARALIIVACWIAVTVISAVSLWVGGANLWTGLLVGLLIAMAFVLTFGLTFGIALAVPGSRSESRTLYAIQKEISDLNTKISELTTKVDTIKKAIEE